MHILLRTGLDSVEKFSQSMAVVHKLQHTVTFPVVSVQKTIASCATMKMMLQCNAVSVWSIRGMNNDHRAEYTLALEKNNYTKKLIEIMEC